MVYDPEQQKMSGEALSQFQELWANNGDVISRQYTGTDAIKVTITPMIVLYSVIIFSRQIG